MADRTDVVVIGGGVVGLSTASALAERGRSVVVVEKDALGSGCSCGNAGLVVPSHVVPLAAPGAIAQGMRWMLSRTSPFRIKPRLDLGLLAWLWAFRKACSERHVQRAAPLLRDLNLASRALLEEWAADGENEDFGFAPSGLLMLHETKKGHRKDLEEAERARQAGLEVSVLNRAELDALTPHLPERARGGVYYHQDALLDPARLVRVLKRRLERQGVELRTGTEVTGFDVRGSTIRQLQTTRGDLRADRVVLAAGSWSEPLARRLDLKLRVEPAKGYSVTLDVSKGEPAVPFILTEKKVSVTPLGGRMRFAGTLELAGFDASVDLHRVQPILDVAAEYVPDIDPSRPSRDDVWVGFRPCTPDGLPVVGSTAQYDNLVVATGHCMMGVSMAPITGQLVADIVQGEPPSIDISLLHPDRFAQRSNASTSRC